MYPPKVSDEAIRRTIRGLTVAGKLPSGAALRAALVREFGSPGGVARIYRLLSAENLRLNLGLPASVGMGLLDQENRNLRQQLQQLRDREDAHQAYWSRQIGQLREQLQKLEPLMQQAQITGNARELLQKQVQDAEVRGGQLEVALRAFGPAAGRSQSGS